MANPTTNFGWQMPTSTDLVTDLPADFEVFGQAVDTALVDLKGGTTGQVLSKASNTNMDFTWVTTDDANAIQNSIVDAKGDLVAASANDTPARLAVGANGTVLTADSAEATGLKWATPAGGGGMTLLSTTTLSSTSTTISSISGDYKHLLVVAKGLTTSANPGFLEMRCNSDTGSNYSTINIRQIGNTVTGTGTLSGTSIQTWDRLQSSSTLNKLGSGEIWIYRYTDTDHVNIFSRVYGNTDTDIYCDTRTSRYDNSAAITSITFLSTSTIGGTIYLYGVN